MLSRETRLDDNDTTRLFPICSERTAMDRASHPEKPGSLRRLGRVLQVYIHCLVASDGGDVRSDFPVDRDG
jgi:hypothetical protein